MISAPQILWWTDPRHLLRPNRPLHGRPRHPPSPSPCRPCQAQRRAAWAASAAPRLHGREHELELVHALLIFSAENHLFVTKKQENTSRTCRAQRCTRGCGARALPFVSPRGKSRGTCSNSEIVRKIVQLYNMADSNRTGRRRSMHVGQGKPRNRRRASAALLLRAVGVHGRRNALLN